MTTRERVINMFNFKPCDVPVLDCYVSPCSLYEHGEKIIPLYESCPDDFHSSYDLMIPQIPVGDFDEEGLYHSYEVDKWGVTWEKRIFGIWGHPIKRPLDDISNLPSYCMPKNVYAGQVDLEVFRSEVAEKKKKLFVRAGSVSLFEIMHSMRRFEDVLMDINEDTEEINLLADMLCEYQARDIDFLINAGVDAINFGDDFGMTNGLMMSPAVWRRFFKERYRKLMQPIHDNDIKILFHSCGNISTILPDLCEVGIDSIWTQLSAYHMPEFAKQCRELGLIAMLHIDRAKIMTNGTPEDVKRGLDEIVKNFDPVNGGSFLYIEVDNGFPFENIEMLFNTIVKMRTIKV